MKETLSYFALVFFRKGQHKIKYGVRDFSILLDLPAFFGWATRLEFILVRPSNLQH